MQIWIQVSITNQVTLGDRKKSNVEGKGVVVVVNTKSGDKKQIYGVLYVPNLTHNFLSVGQLVKRGYFVAFDNDECAVIDKKSNVIFAKLKMAENNVFFTLFATTWKYGITSRYLWWVLYLALAI